MPGNNNCNGSRDESNQDTGFDRNYLRHQVLPLLQQRWPAASKVLARFAGVNDSTSAAMDFFVQGELQRLLQDDASLPIERLESFPLEVQWVLLRGWLAQCGAPAPEQQALQRIITEVVEAPDDAQPLLQWAGFQVRRYRDCLYGMPALAAIDSELCVRWSGPEKPPVELANAGRLSVESAKGAGIDSAFAEQDWQLRFRRGGERCRPYGRQGHHTHEKPV